MKREVPPVPTSPPRNTGGKSRGVGPVAPTMRQSGSDAPGTFKQLGVVATGIVGSAFVAMMKRKKENGEP
jgi:hypothetical protein